MEVIKGQYNMEDWLPKLSSSQLVGLTPCAKRINSYLTPFYNSRNLSETIFLDDVLHDIFFA